MGEKATFKSSVYIIIRKEGIKFYCTTSNEKEQDLPNLLKANQ